MRSSCRTSGRKYFKQDFSDSEDKGSVGVNLGAKYYFAKKAAFDVSGNYLFTLNKDQEGGMLYFAVGSQLPVVIQGCRVIAEPASAVHRRLRASASSYAPGSSHR